MYVIKIAIYSFLILGLVFGCKKNKPTDIVDKQTTVELIHPVNATVLYCCFEFLWSSNVSRPARLQVSRDPDFAELVIDTLLEANNYMYDKKFIPSVLYYWRVQIDSTVESSSFTVEDVITQEGVIQVSAFRHCYGDIPVNCDSTYQSSIEVTKEGDKIHLVEVSSDLNDVHCFADYWGYQNELAYFSPNFTTIGSYVVIDVDTDSIQVHRNNGGLGGGVGWSFKGKLER